MSKSTLHREVQKFARDMCDWPDLKRVPYRFLMVDGTKVRLQKKAHPSKESLRKNLNPSQR